MQIVPVLDLKGGVVVHARRGQRAGYAPLRSPLVDGCEPLAVARALGARCRTRRLYVADLDALGGAAVNEAMLAALATVAEPWVDAGATTVDRAAALARAGVARNVVGTESIGPGTVVSDDSAGPAGPAGPAGLTGPAGPADLTGPAPPRVLSVDLRDGALISPRPDLAGRRPAAAVPLARGLGVRELVVIDLARVGSGAGPPLEAVAELAAALPDVAIYAGGGVRHDGDLRALESAGAAGALVATALHEGRLTL